MNYNDSVAKICNEVISHGLPKFPQSRNRQERKYLEDGDDPTFVDPRTALNCSQRNK